MNIEQARINMVEQQIRPWAVLDRQILAVFQQIPRENFVPPPFRSMAFADIGIPLSHGQSMLRPNLDGRILQCLTLSPTDRVLEVGTGSGFLTACLAQLAEHVESIDIYPDFSKRAALQLAKLHIDNVSLAVGDAAQQWRKTNYYNAIVLGGSLPSIPDAHLQALAANGRMFAVIGQADEPIMEAMLVTRKSTDQWTQESLFETWIPPLINANAGTRFSW
jgi:protein-L-isoaspartate(D-aspartate) O-methyltransferase